MDFEQKMVEDKQNRSCKVHNVRFYTLAPRAINYLAYNDETSKLALSRLVIECFHTGCDELRLNSRQFVKFMYS